MPVDVGKFIKSPEFGIRIVTYRDVFQSGVCEEDRLGEECRDLSAVIVLDASEMKHMGIKDGSNVRLTNQWGSVVVRAKASPQDEQKGVGFMVNSPWVNALVSGEAADGIPGFKNIDAKITVSREEITTLGELFGD